MAALLPSSRSTALALIDRGHTESNELSATVATGPEIRHPYKQAELVP